MSTFTKRLKMLRKENGLTLEKLGTLADIDEFSAAVRIHHYEIGRSEPNFELIEKLAKVLKVPPGYFFTRDETQAQIMRRVYLLKKAQRHSVLTFVEKLEISEKDLMLQNDI